MKLILGDNQFFGVNHSDLAKAEKVRSLFGSDQKISDFISLSLKLGLDGFMINSNDLGYKVVERFDFNSQKTECHYSIPYPHKYAGMVNDSGILALFSHVYKQIKFRDAFSLLKFFLTFNAVHLIPIIIRLEIPKTLPKGSVVYLQNVVTDLILGLRNGDVVLKSYIRGIRALDYKPGLITLNLTSLTNILVKDQSQECLYICFNVNYSGFNVFPVVKIVEDTISYVQRETNWKLMGMSVFSSGSKTISIEKSIEYVKSLKLDYVVFGSSSLINLKQNIDFFNDGNLVH